MVFKKIREKLLKAKAKAHGMTVPELKQYLAERKVEKYKFKMELRRKEQKEKAKFEKWKVEQKYKQKRKQAKAGKSTGVLGMIELFGGSPSKTTNPDPLGLFGPPTKKRKRRKKH